VGPFLLADPTGETLPVDETTVNRTLEALRNPRVAEPPVLFSRGGAGQSPSPISPRRSSRERAATGRGSSTSLSPSVPPSRRRSSTSTSRYCPKRVSSSTTPRRRRLRSRPMHRSCGSTGWSRGHSPMFRISSAVPPGGIGVPTRAALRTGRRPSRRPRTCRSRRHQQRTAIGCCGRCRGREPNDPQPANRRLRGRSRACSASRRSRAISRTDRQRKLRDAVPRPSPPPVTEREGR